MRAIWLGELHLFPSANANQCQCQRGSTACKVSCSLHAQIEHFGPPFDAVKHKTSLRHEWIPFDCNSATAIPSNREHWETFVWAQFPILRRFCTQVANYCPNPSNFLVMMNHPTLHADRPSFPLSKALVSLLVLSIALSCRSSVELQALPWHATLSTRGNFRVSPKLKPSQTLDLQIYRSDRALGSIKDLLSSDAKVPEKLQFCDRSDLKSTKSFLRSFSSPCLMTLKPRLWAACVLLPAPSKQQERWGIWQVAEAFSCPVPTFLRRFAALPAAATAGSWL